ncbi:MAG TPA: sulfite exporter TauE/SafE family protein [Dehalococcoidia bacterium]|nr:sulfite exporter TauE/SafE family protein [Dehalococcoidia bacterium]
MATELLLLVPLGFAVAAYGTVIGAGGGFVLVPALLLLYPDYGPEKVTSISLAVIFANATSGSVAYARQQRIDYRTGLLFAGSSLPGVVGGALLVQVIPTSVFSVLFSVVIIALAAFSLRGPPQAIQRPRTGRGMMVRTIRLPDGRTYRYSYRVWQGVLLSLGVGFVSSLFGIGGGLIHVPAMILWIRMPVHFAVATSHFILALMSGGATALHLGTGTLAGHQLAQAAALGVGAVPGAQAGAFVAQRLRGRTIRTLLVVALVVLAARLLVKGVAGV